MTDLLPRLAIFLCVVLALWFAERQLAWHRVPAMRAPVRVANVILGAVGAVGVRLLLPWAGVAAAVTAATHNVGLAHWFGWSPWLAGVVAFFVLDLAIYAQHRATHAVPLLWRLHRVHHTETHLDLTSALRFHPLEIVGSAAWRWVVILALGAPAASVIVFESVLSATALFNHSNLKLPDALDRVLRRVVVTPAMHRVHHSTAASEQRHNFGFNVPWWDWFFGSYQRESSQGPEVPRIGVTGRPVASQNITLSLLAEPFK
ncbi:MAG: sterol desaturase family protein [Proteobacteria bacterium]|nr:sterol desaturase family protein [Pseudomonadota bacterium]